MRLTARSAPFAFLVAGLAVGVVSHADSEGNLDEVVVVATRVPQTLDKIGNQVSVITEAQIRESQATDVTELVATTPGISFSRNGGPGTVTSLSIRGADADHAVILIDGVALTDPSSIGGAINFGDLIVGDISRIEILRGAQSTLYGSQAIGGVINIVTTEPHQGYGADLQGERGSLDTGLIKGGLSGKGENWSLRLGATYYSTNSVSAFDRQYGGVEADPYHNTVLTGRATYDFLPNVGLDLRAYYSTSRVNNDGFPPPFFEFADEGDFQKTRQFADYTGVHFDLLDGRFTNKLDFQYTITDRGDFLSTPTGTQENDWFTGTNSRLEYQGSFQFNPQYRAVFGAQYERELMDSLPPAAAAHAETGDNSAYVQFQGEVIQGLTLTAGERFDHYDTYGKHATGQAAVAWTLPSNTVLRASWAQGFKAPSLFQLDSQYGNPDVQAERSKDYDIGVEQRLFDSRVTLSAAYFHIDFINLIDFYDCPGSPLCFAPGHSSFGFYANLGRARSSGAELQASAKITAALTLSANYTHTKTEDLTLGSPTYGQPALRRPTEAANLQVSYVWPFHLTTTAAARYGGAVNDENFNAFPAQIVRLGGYTLWDLRVAYDINEHFQVYARCDNCTDKRYETIYQYGAWGRTAFLGGRIKY